MNKLPIILDTDIGDDIDDAFALALLHSLPNVNLLGVTTVYRDTKARAQMVHKFFSTVNETKIPVRAGESQPLKEPLKTLPNEKDTLGKPCSWDPLCEAFAVDAEPAIDFIIRKANEFSGHLILVPIGALTNIAKAIEKDPSLVRKVKKIVLMGGWFTNHAPEWNILCDPEAADIVFGSGIAIECVGLDVTLQCTLDEDLLRRLFHRPDPQSQLLSFWFRLWQKSTKFAKSVMHDPLAAATLVAPVCTFVPQRVKVNLTTLRGAIDVLPMNSSEGSIVKVAEKLDRTAFFDLFKRQLLNEETLPL